MQAANLTQAELARRVGVAQPTIFGLINSNKIGSKHLHRIARELSTTPAYLAGETDDPQADVPDAPELSRDEWLWVEYWRALDRDRRAAVVQVVQLLVHDSGELATVHAPRPAYAGQPG